MTEISLIVSLNKKFNNMMGISLQVLTGAMKYYQGILESLFYYFKKSPKRCEEIESIKALKETTLKYREVHKAHATVYREVPRGVRNSKVRRQDKFRRDWSRH